MPFLFPHFRGLEQEMAKAITKSNAKVFKRSFIVGYLLF